MTCGWWVSSNTRGRPARAFSFSLSHAPCLVALRRGHPMLISRQTSIIGFPFKIIYHFCTPRPTSALFVFGFFSLPMRYCLHGDALPGSRAKGYDIIRPGRSSERVFSRADPADRLNSATAAAVFSTGHLFHDPFYIYIYNSATPARTRLRSQRERPIFISCHPTGSFFAARATGTCSLPEKFRHIRI